MNTFTITFILMIVFIYSVRSVNIIDDDIIWLSKTEKIRYTSPSLYDFTTDPKYVEIYGDLILPLSCDKCPVMVMLHGSLGWKKHHNEYYNRLVDMGIGIFKIYSFESRNICITKGSQLSVTHQMMISDAYSALNVLNLHPSVDINRIGITGFSLGGGASILAGWNVPLHQQLANTNFKFNVHIGLYPPCFIVPDEHMWTDSPLIVMIGEKDQWTPASPCIGFFANIYSNTGYNRLNKHLIIYPNEHHSFDNREPLKTVSNALNFENCEFIINSDNETIHIDENNNIIHMNTPENRILAFNKCTSIDDHIIGYNSNISKEKAFIDYIYYVNMYL